MKEHVRTREAEYKHLQSQINPHFLYNCLFYIVSMANKSPAAVISMAKNLPNFYRYITRKAGTNSTIEDEIRLIESYLEVQSLRNKRLTYEIDIPPSMLVSPSLPYCFSRLWRTRSCMAWRKKGIPVTFIFEESSLMINTSFTLMTMAPDYRERSCMR